MNKLMGLKDLEVKGTFLNTSLDVLIKNLPWD